MPGGLPAQQRVRKRSEFKAIQARARRVLTPHFALLLLARAPETRTSFEEPARLGITASRRVGNAVTRNRAKRLIREAFRQSQDLWQPGLDLVVIVRQALEGMSPALVVEEWRAVSRQIAARSQQARVDRKGP